MVVVIAAVTLAAGMVAGEVAEVTSGSHVTTRAPAAVPAPSRGVAYRALVAGGADGRAVDPGLFSPGACVGEPAAGGAGPR
jgi:hypothetical protein